jgi:catechol 1,2-dioxygenase
VDFKPREGDPKAILDLEYNVILAPKFFNGAIPHSQSSIGLDSKLAVSKL